MLRVTYEEFCDVCAAKHDSIFYNIGTGGVIPAPPRQVVMNNATLCPGCAELATTAMNEALKDRLATETTSG
jgi:hypothetical protein